MCFPRDPKRRLGGRQIGAHETRQNQTDNRIRTTNAVDPWKYQVQQIAVLCRLCVWVCVCRLFTHETVPSPARPTRSPSLAVVDQALNADYPIRILLELECGLGHLCAQCFRLRYSAGKRVVPIFSRSAMFQAFGNSLGSRRSVLLRIHEL